MTLRGEKLSANISRALFSLERMSFNEGSDTVLYRGEHFHTTLARNFEVSNPLEWIALITSHIPGKGAKQVILLQRRRTSVYRVSSAHLPVIMFDCGCFRSYGQFQVEIGGLLGRKVSIEPM